MKAIQREFEQRILRSLQIAERGGARSIASREMPVNHAEQCSALRVAGAFVRSDFISIWMQ